jgi:predicted Zn-dependent peptidase
VDGTVTTVEGLQLADIRRAQGAVFDPASATVLVAGDITADQARTSLERAFGSWRASGGSVHGTEAVTLPRHEQLKVVVVDRPGAVQTVIRFITPGIEYSDTRRVGYRLINTLLGGSFTSRLNQNIREDKGYSYGAGSRFIMQPDTGWFIASSSVQSQVTGPAVKEFLNEFARLRSGDISAEEVTKASQTLRTDVIQAFQGLSGLLAVASDLVVNGVPFTSLSEDLAQMKRMTAGELNALADQAIPLQQGVLVLVGDRSMILDQIRDLGLPSAVEYTDEGTPAK